MVRIIDNSRGESVGKIEDTGSYSTDDGLLEGYLEDFVENGVETLVCEHTNTGVNYRLGIVEAGDKNFALAVIQHLPSPYYGDEDEIIDLGDYEVVEDRQEEDSPIRGKQGMSDTIHMFTSLASESSGPTRERVDAEWNEVEDEENLPDIVKQAGLGTVIVQKESVEESIDELYSTISKGDLEVVDLLFNTFNIDKKKEHLRKEFKIATEGETGTEKYRAIRSVIVRNSEEFTVDELRNVASEFGWGGKNFRITETGLIQKQDIPHEYRQYVDSREEAPEDVHVYEGEREDALYYDTRDTTSDPYESEGVEELYDAIEEDDFHSAVSNTIESHVDPDISIQHLNREDTFQVGQSLLWASDIGYLDEADVIKTLSEEETEEEFVSDNTVAQISDNRRNNVKTLKLGPDVLDGTDVVNQHVVGHLSTDMESHYLYHEIAHLAQDKKKNNVDFDHQDYNNTWKEIIDGEYMEESSMEEIIMNEVSSYAASSPRDFIAETWVGLIYGENYSDNIIDLYTKLQGPGVPQW